MSWTDKRSNDWLLQKAETKPHLLQAIKKRKLSFYGHVSRKEGSCMEKEIIQGILDQAKDAEEDQRSIGMTTSWSGLG